MQQLEKEKARLEVMQAKIREREKSMPSDDDESEELGYVRLGKRTYQ